MLSESIFQIVVSKGINFITIACAFCNIIQLTYSTTRKSGRICPSHYWLHHSISE